MQKENPLETLYREGIPVCPPNGSYRILIDDVHWLTKKISHGEGQNFLPWYKHPLCPWRWLSKRFNLPTGDFFISYNEYLKSCVIEYRDGTMFDYIRQVRGRGLPNTWVGFLVKNGETKLHFLMEKI